MIKIEERGTKRRRRELIRLLWNVAHVVLFSLHLTGVKYEAHLFDATGVK
jgi:hypothetical protein